MKKPEDLPIQRTTKRPGRRIQKNMCLSPTDPYSGMLTTGLFHERCDRDAGGKSEKADTAQEDTHSRSSKTEHHLDEGLLSLSCCPLVLCCADVVFLGSGVSVEPDNHWGSQINQLEQLIDKLECEVCRKSVFVLQGSLQS